MSESIVMHGREQDATQSVRQRFQLRKFDPRRIWLAGMGVCCVGMGALGVFVPGLPTTIFLIIASWCFTRSCPWLEQRLIRNRFFAPFLRYLEPGTVMPTRARIIATCALWAGLGCSLVILIAGELPVSIPVIVVASGVVGTVAIWCMARCQRGGCPVAEPVGEAA